MEALKIEIPKGFEIDSVDKLSGEVTFKEKPDNVMRRIETITDVLADNGFTQEGFDQSCEGLSGDEIAYRILKMLAISLNEGWTPDWDNSSESKYFPWFVMGGSSGFRFYGHAYWYTDSHVGSRLCFKRPELARYAGEKFIDVYKKFMVIG